MQEFEDSTIRRFVVGDLDDASRAKLETEAIGDEDLFARIEAIEDEIIEEYLAGKLPGGERKAFDETLDSIPGRRQRVAIVKTLSARNAPSPAASNVVSFTDRLRFASHARLAIAAGFAAAAITALIFIQARQSATEANPPAASVARASSVVPAPQSPAQPPPAPETSSALAARRPGFPMAVAPARPIESVAATSVVTFILTSGTVRSGDGGRTLDIAPGVDAVDFQIAVEDDEFSHYHAELRASDGTVVSSHRGVPVTATEGAPMIGIRVPASALHDGRFELVLAGAHERGAEEVAYIEFDVHKR